MRLFDRLFETKGFVEPPFWTMDALNFSSGLVAKERIAHDFEAYVQHVYKTNGIVFACQLARMLVFAEARFLWRTARSSGDFSRPFGNRELALIERPWTNGTTGDLLARMEQDASIAGNYYATTADDRGRVGRAATGPGRRIARLRPDWMTIVMGSQSGDITDPDTKIIAFWYQSPSHREPWILLPEEVCHFAPIPDPLAGWRGMSWMTPILREVQADKAATKHKLKFFENGATLSNIVTLDKEVTPAAFKDFVREFNRQHEGVDTAYKTLFLGGGADATVVGADLKQLDFKMTQGAGETRIAADARVPPVIVGLSEGLQGSSLNTGNYSAARRSFADGFLRPSWRMAAGALENLLTVPTPQSVLVPDVREVAFLRDDGKDMAEIQQTQAAAINQLVSAGFEPPTVVEAVLTNDWSRLTHNGLFSVQLQPPGTTASPPADGMSNGQPAQNGQNDNALARR